MVRANLHSLLEGGSVGEGTSVGTASIDRQHCGEGAWQQCGLHGGLAQETELKDSSISSHISGDSMSFKLCKVNMFICT